MTNQDVIINIQAAACVWMSILFNISRPANAAMDTNLSFHCSKNYNVHFYIQKLSFSILKTEAMKL